MLTYNRSSWVTNIEKLPMFGSCDEDKVSTSHMSGSISPTG
jgi:hypothetical protein